MPIHHTWDNPERTIYCFYAQADWTWSDFDSGVHDAYEIISLEAARVDIIFCFETELPPGNALSNMRHMGGSQPSNIYRTIMVNQSGLFLESLIRTIDKSMGWEGPTIVATIEEARRLLSTSPQNES